MGATLKCCNKLFGVTIKVTLMLIMSPRLEISLQVCLWWLTRQNKDGVLIIDIIQVQGILVCDYS